jgi:hypothetical protein
VVPGLWTLELWKGDRRLLVQHFELVPPPPVNVTPDANTPDPLPPARPNR